MPEDQKVPPKAAAVVDDSDSEDDLDDLDDLLDEFQADSKPAAATAAGSSGAAAAAADGVAGGLDPDFAKTLEMGMADLLSEINDSPELKEEFDKLVKELNEATAAPAPADSPVPPLASSSRPAPTAAAEVPAPSSSKPKSFADTINATVNRMETSNTTVTDSLAEEESDDFLAEMLKQMSGTMGSGGGSDEDLSKMLLGIMEQLTNKEILYEPMKELAEKFPPWLEKNGGEGSKSSEEELKRYREQAGLVRDIVDRFEAPGYSDDNTADREFIVDRMQKMQASGTPPQDLMDGLTEGGLDALPDLESCGIQ